MNQRRVAALVIVAGAVGSVVGRLLFPSRGVYEDLWSVWNTYLYLTVGLSVTLVGLAIRYLVRSDAGRLVAIALVAVVAMLFVVNDFGDGDPVWSRPYSTNGAVGAWLIIVSTVVMFIGVLWSTGQHLTDATATSVWWRKQWVVAVGGVVVLVIVGRVGLVFFGDEDPGPAAEVAGEDDPGPVQDQWRIAVAVDDEGGAMRNVYLIRTFSAVEAAGVQHLGGRLIWAQTELELCGVAILSAGDGFVQIGNIFPACEEREPVMVQAFDDYGLPHTACLVIRSGSRDDEYCAPLTAN